MRRALRTVLLLVVALTMLLALPAAPASAGWNDGGKCNKHWVC